MSDSFRSYVGQIQISANGNLAVSGIGFQPKIVIFINNGTNAIDTVSTGFNFSIGYGVSSSNQKCFYAHSQNGVTPSYARTGAVFSDVRCFMLRNEAGTVLGDVDLVSMDSDGFTINVINFASFVKPSFLALGGSDLIVSADSFDISTGTGSQAVTGVGFQPEAMIFMTPNFDTAGFAKFDGEISIGITDGTNQYAMNGFSENSANPTTTSRSVLGNAVIKGNSGWNTTELVASLSSFNSDGFTINKTTNTKAGVASCIYIALKGVELKVGTVTGQTSTGNYNYSGANFRPKALFAMNPLSSAIPADNAQLWSNGLGFSDENLNNASITVLDQHNVNPANTDRYHDTNHIYSRFFLNTGGSIDGSFYISSYNSDGFTYTQDDADPGGAVIVPFLLFGDKDRPFSPILSMF